MKVGQKLSDEVTSRFVAGPNLVPGSLGDQLPEGALTLAVFLRHFGCIFCKETLADIRQRQEVDPDFPSPLFFFQGSATEGRALLRRDWPEARAVADPEGRFYDDFGVGRGGLLKMFGPGVFAGKTRAEKKGHENGARSGDIWRMPGMFLLRGREIVWKHEYRHAAELPDYDRITALATGSADTRD